MTCTAEEIKRDNFCGKTYNMTEHGYITHMNRADTHASTQYSGSRHTHHTQHGDDGDAEVGRGRVGVQESTKHEVAQEALVLPHRRWKKKKRKERKKERKKENVFYIE
jgi:hypothetical protein